MAVIFNAKGTTSPYFLLGKGGTTLFQGSADPTGSYTAAAGDVWFDTNTKTLKFRNAGNSDWVQGSIDITGDATISGNLTVNGTTTLVSTTNTTVSDSLIELSTGTTGSPLMMLVLLLSEATLTMQFLLGMNQQINLLLAQQLPLVQVQAT